MADQQNFQNLIDKLKGVMPTGDTSGNALNPSAPPQNFLGQILNKSGLGDEKQSDPDAVQSMQSPIDYAAGGVGAKLGESLGPSISKVAGNEIGSIGNLKPASYESPALGKNLADEADAAVSKITKEGLNKSPTEAALNDMSDNVIPMNQESKDALPLDMSKDARMQRAKDMGFDTDRTYYHGTKADINEFDPNKSSTTPGAFFTEDKFYANGVPTDMGTPDASGYKYQKGANVIPVKLNIKNLFDPDNTEQFDKLKQYISDKYPDSSQFSNRGTDRLPDLSRLKDSDMGYLQSETKPVQQFLKDNGFSGQHVYEGNGKNIQMLDPSKIRSVNADFDPAKKASGNILAGLGGAGLLSATKDDDQDKFDQIKQLLQRR